jgi:hypothetical protein
MRTRACSLRWLQKHCHPLVRPRDLALGNATLDGRCGVTAVMSTSPAYTIDELQGGKEADSTHSSRAESRRPWASLERGLMINVGFVRGAFPKILRSRSCWSSRLVTVFRFTCGSGHNLACDNCHAVGLMNCLEDIVPRLETRFGVKVPIFAAKIGQSHPDIRFSRHSCLTSRRRYRPWRRVQVRCKDDN